MTWHSDKVHLRSLHNINLIDMKRFIETVNYSNYFSPIIELNIYIFDYSILFLVPYITLCMVRGFYVSFGSCMLSFSLLASTTFGSLHCSLIDRVFHGVHQLVNIMDSSSYILVPTCNFFIHILT